MKYQIKDLHIYNTPKAEGIHQFQDMPSWEFEFPERIRTILFLNCGLVHASVRGGQDYFEIVGRLYGSFDPQETDEPHIGKLYIHVYDYPSATRYETSWEQINWNADGSFDCILPTGERHRIHPPTQ